MARTAIREKVTTTSTISRGTTTALRSVQVTEDQIRERAYKIYLGRAARGRGGDALGDWNQAKEELQREAARMK
ncbi:MAG TPA: hypothetical protein PKK06_08500 [Phycisphaerae bacterium]|nr:hypothetical protein [Phycisphaerae bacterium]HNU45250.1 hypothetical protein [Phycisphaerae bacterium]